MSARGPTEREVLEQVSRVDTGCVIPHCYSREKLRKKGWIAKMELRGIAFWRITRNGLMELDFHRKETA